MASSSGAPADTSISASLYTTQPSLSYISPVIISNDNIHSDVLTSPPVLENATVLGIHNAPLLSCSSLLIENFNIPSLWIVENTQVIVCPHTTNHDIMLTFTLLFVLFLACVQTVNISSFVLSPCAFFCLLTVDNIVCPDMIVYPSQEADISILQNAGISHS